MVLNKWIIPVASHIIPSMIHELKMIIRFVYYCFLNLLNLGICFYLTIMFKPNYRDDKNVKAAKA